MRTETALAALAALLTAAPGRAFERERFEVGLSPEVTLVGLSFGARPEVSWRLGAGTASRLRFAPGLLLGPEFSYVPVTLGWRAVYRSQKTVRPLFGAGLEQQTRWVSDGPAAVSGGIYLEGGVLFGIGAHLSVGLAATLDVMFLGEPGAGLAPRLVAGWRL